MRATPKVFGVAVSALALALFLPTSSSAGTITIVDNLANDTISFTTDGAATTARLGLANCPANEASGCSFTIAPIDPAVSSSADHSPASLLEPLTQVASDTLTLTNTAQFGGTTWTFFSDRDGVLTAPDLKAAAFAVTENGTAQLMVTITYVNAAGQNFATDQIFIQSDLDPVATPEPASASLLLLGGGILVAAGRLRKRVHE
jgi:hypothetical protein